MAPIPASLHPILFRLAWTDVSIGRSVRMPANCYPTLLYSRSHYPNAQRAASPSTAAAAESLPSGTVNSVMYDRPQWRPALARGRPAGRRKSHPIPGWVRNEFCASDIWAIRTVLQNAPALPPSPERYNSATQSLPKCEAQYSRAQDCPHIARCRAGALLSRLATDDTNST